MLRMVNFGDMLDGTDARRERLLHRRGAGFNLSCSCSSFYSALSQRSPRLCGENPLRLGVFAVKCNVRILTA